MKPNGSSKKLLDKAQPIPPQSEAKKKPETLLPPPQHHQPQQDQRSPRQNHQPNTVSVELQPGENSYVSKRAVQLLETQKNFAEAQANLAIVQRNEALKDKKKALRTCAHLRKKLEAYKKKLAGVAQVISQPNTKFIDHFSLQDKKQISDELRSRLSYIAKIC